MVVDIFPFTTLTVGHQKVDVSLLERGEGPLTRGMCINLRARSHIHIYRSAIVESVKYRVPIGGNATFANSEEEGILLCLAHELRHVQQYVEQGHPLWASDLAYDDQPHEVDARRFVDQNYTVILENRWPMLS